jgi:diguanylate cyclase
MSALITLSVVAVFGAFVGLLAGWLLRGKEEVTVEKVVTKTVEKIVEVVPEDIVAQRDQAATVLMQLEQLALGVSMDISAHSAKVGDINSELSGNSSGDAEGIVAVAIRQLIESNNAMQAKLDDARTDQLTKLNNRRAFDDELLKRSAEFEQKQTPVSLMLIDVDHFKKFNDTHGHQAGDEVLRSVGRVLSEKTFGKEGLFPARYGGEEFAVVFAGNTFEAAAQIGERIRSAIGETPVVFEGKTLHVTASAGIALLNPGEKIESFIARSDEALYASKKANRNCLHSQKEGACTKVIPNPTFTAQAVPVAETKGDDVVRHVSTRIAEWKRGGNPISVIVARLDNLAQVETTLEPVKVDQIRAAVRDLLQSVLREMDTIAPWLGDMYGMMLPTAKLVDAARVAERMRLLAEGGELDSLVGSHTTLSFGVAEVSIDDDGEALLLRARRAMEQARRKGGNVVYIHDGRQSDPASDRLDLAALSWADAAL